MVLPGKGLFLLSYCPLCAHSIMPETCSSLLSVMGLWELWHRCFVLKRVSPESSFSFRFVKELNYILNLEALTNPKECQIGQLSGSFINWYNVFNTNSPEFLIWKNSCGKTRSRRLGFREESRCQSFFFSFSVFVSFLSAFISFLIMKLKKKKICSSGVCSSGWGERAG